MKGFQLGLKPEHTFEQFVAAGASNFKKLLPGWKFRIKTLEKDLTEVPQGRGDGVMSNIVEFPPSDRPITESEIDKLHSEAFRNLEPSICDCESMAKIAAQIAMNTKTEDRELVFAVVHAMEMLTALKTN
jgi:hypothetical protein